MNFKLPEMKNLDLDGVLSGVDMTVSTDAIDGMAARLIEGYLDYTSMHPEADYANLGQYFLNYLSTESARKILNDNLLSILAENDTFAVSDEELQQLFKDVLTGYQQYAAEKGYTDPSKFDEYLLEYLRSDAGKAILNRWGSQIIEKNGNFTVSDAQLKKLASDLAAGYTSYAKRKWNAEPGGSGEIF